MAGFSRAHGDSNGVVNVDIADAGQTSLAVPINVAGPKLDFFSMDLNSDASGEMATGGAIDSVIKIIQQKATVYVYQLSQSSHVLSVAVYPTAAWTAGDLEDQIQALGTVSGFDLSSVQVENHGLRLLNDSYC
jgi:hypothetical protein